MLVRVIAVRVIAFLLIAEALFGALRLSMLLPQLGIYDPVAIALIAVRGTLGALQFAGGWLLANKRPAGPVIARWALIAGAVLTVFDVGLRLAPSSIYYWYRWQVTAAYGLYAVTAIWCISAASDSDDGTAREGPAS